MEEPADRVDTRPLPENRTRERRLLLTLTKVTCAGDIRVVHPVRIQLGAATACEAKHIRQHINVVTRHDETIGSGQRTDFEHFGAHPHYGLRGKCAPVKASL